MKENETVRRFKAVANRTLTMMHCVLLVFWIVAAGFILKVQPNPDMVIPFFLGALGLSILTELLNLYTCLWQKQKLTANANGLKCSNFDLTWDQMESVKTDSSRPNVLTFSIQTSKKGNSVVALSLQKDEIPAFAELLQAHAPVNNCLRVAVGEQS